jgi:cysteine-rich secretory family protein
MRVIGPCLVVIALFGVVFGLFTICHPLSPWYVFGSEPPVILESKPYARPHDEELRLDGKGRFDSVTLCKYAQIHADDMATTGKFEHSDLRPLVEQYGVCRENICWVYGDATWEQAYEQWRASPGHAANIEYGGKHVGFGRGFNGTHTYFVVIYTTRDPWFRDGF